jgi:hypothetical protein
MATLYEIDKAILECVDAETGEIIDDKALEELELARDNKIENIACWIKNLKADAESYKKEKEVFIQKEKAAKNKAESLKRYLEMALGGEKFKTSKVSISYRKSEIIEIDEIEKLSDKFIKIEKKADKKAIKAAIKEGAEIVGARIVENNNIQIK